MQMYDDRYLSQISDAIVQVRDWQQRLTLDAIIFSPSWSQDKIYLTLEDIIRRVNVR